MLYLQILETLPSNPGQHREHLPHPRVKHKKAVMGIRGVGPPPPPSSKPAKAQTGGTRMKAPHLKELCSVCALFKSQSGRWPTISHLNLFLCKSPVEIQYVGVLSIAVMQAFSKTKFECSAVTNWEYNCSTTVVKANGAPTGLTSPGCQPGLLGASPQAALLQPSWPGDPALGHPTFFPTDWHYLHCCLSIRSWSNKNKLS